MAGIKIEVVSNVEPKVSNLVAGIEHLAPLHAKMREYVHRTTLQRFQTQSSPDGVAWEELQPKYKKRKHRNQDKILTLRGHLRKSLHGRSDDDGLEYGSGSVYGAIHQLGGVIKRAAGKTKKGKKIGAATIKIPARPYLGLSAANNKHFIVLAKRFLKKSLG